MRTSIFHTLNNRVSISVDDQTPPFSFVEVHGSRKNTES